MKNKKDITLYDLVKMDKKFGYQFLGRLESDCAYYLGYGHRNPKVLWAGNEETHIKIMKNVWDCFTDEEKPNWLSWSDILEYEEKMKSSKKRR